MSELKQRWQALRETQSGLRIRDAAAQLGVSEAALLETRLQEGVSRLAVRVDTLCAALPHLGTVMSLIRNDAAVHEKDIAFSRGIERGDTIHFEGEDYSLTLQPSTVAHAFHVEDASAKGPLRSIQLFDASGTALWKIYARDKADHTAFDRLLTEITWPRAIKAMPFTRPVVSSTVAVTTHRPVDLQALLEGIAEKEIPVSLEVANHGVRQSHRARLIRIVRMGPWLNVLDPGFDWHLNENSVAAITTDIEDTASLTLHLASGGVAARLAASSAATDEQQAAWRGAIEKAAS